MSKEKQIEELTNELVFTRNYGTYNAVANYLVNKGYRKQSEGEWGFDGMSWTCSECNEYATKGIRTSFCPNCGAKMKGGAE